MTCNAFRVLCRDTNSEPSVNANQYPLRKIVGYEAPPPRFYAIGHKVYQYANDGLLEVLECGHKVPQYVGIYGRENRTKRRCRECFKVEDYTPKKKRPRPRPLWMGPRK